MVNGMSITLIAVIFHDDLARVGSRSVRVRTVSTVQVRTTKGGIVDETMTVMVDEVGCHPKRKNIGFLYPRGHFLRLFFSL